MTATDATDPILTVLDVCRRPRVSRSTLYAWWATEEGPARFTLPGGAVRVRESVLEAWIAGQESEA